MQTAAPGTVFLKSLRRGLSAGMMACMPSLALAADAAVDPGVPTDERLLFRDLPSVFAASRFDQPATAAPADVTVVNAADIERYGYRTLAEVLRAVRGFTVSYDYNYSYLATRGLGVATDYNTRILLLLDGRRLNDGTEFLIALGLEWSRRAGTQRIVAGVESEHDLDTRLTVFE